MTLATPYIGMHEHIRTLTEKLDAAVYAIGQINQIKAHTWTMMKRKKEQTCKENEQNKERIKQQQKSKLTKTH